MLAHLSNKQHWSMKGACSSTEHASCIPNNHIASSNRAMQDDNAISDLLLQLCFFCLASSSSIWYEACNNDQILNPVRQECTADLAGLANADRTV